MSNSLEQQADAFLKKNGFRKNGTPMVAPPVKTKESLKEDEILTAEDILAKYEFCLRVKE